MNGLLSPSPLSSSSSSLPREALEGEQDSLVLEGAITIKDGVSPICTMALGYFCEVHGPTVIFTTQAYPSSTLVSLGEEKDRLRNINSHACYDYVNNGEDDDGSDSDYDDEGSQSFLSSSSCDNDSQDPSSMTQSSVTSSFMPASLSYVPWNLAKSFKKQQFFDFDNASPNSIGSPVYSRSNAMYNSSVAKYISNSAQTQAAHTPSQEPRSVPQRQATSIRRPAQNASTSQSPLSCKFCYSVPENDGYITTDESTRTIFVSKRNFNDTYTLVRQACTRALSCEWAPREVFMTNKQTKSVDIRQSLSQDKFISLGSSTPRKGGVNTSVRAQNAVKNCLMSPEMQPLTQFMFGTYSNGYTLAINFRLDDSKARGNGRWYTIITTWQSSAYLAAIAGNGLFEAAMTPTIRKLQKNASELMRKEGRSISKPVGRTLSEITGIVPERLYEMLHKVFCSAFLSFNNSMFIPCMDVAPQFYPTMKLVLGDIYDKPYSLNNFERPEFCAEVFPANGLASPPTKPYDESYPDLSSSLNAPLIREFKLSTLLCNIGENDRNILLYNCMVGNQIIVRGPNSSVCSVAVRAISRLLPDSLRGPICEYSSVYKPMFEAHFLGLPLTAEIPASDNVNRDFRYQVEDIFESIKGLDDIPDEEEQCLENTFSVKEDETVHAGRAILTLMDDPGKGYVKGPFIPTTIVEEMKEIFVSKSNVAPEVGVSTLKSMKLTLLHERWTNIAKIAYSLKLSEFFNSEKSTKAALSALSLNRKDLYVLKFWMPCVKNKIFSN